MTLPTFLYDMKEALAARDPERTGIVYPEDMRVSNKAPGFLIDINGFARHLNRSPQWVREDLARYGLEINDAPSTDTVNFLYPKNWEKISHEMILDNAEIP